MGIRIRATHFTTGSSDISEDILYPGYPFYPCVKQGVMRRADKGKEDGGGEDNGGKEKGGEVQGEEDKGREQRRDENRR